MSDGLTIDGWISAVALWSIPGQSKMRNAPLAGRHACSLPPDIRHARGNSGATSTCCAVCTRGPEQPALGTYPPQRCIAGSVVLTTSPVICQNCLSCIRTQARRKRNHLKQLSFRDPQRLCFSRQHADSLANVIVPRSILSAGHVVATQELPAEITAPVGKVCSAGWHQVPISWRHLGALVRYSYFLCWAIWHSKFRGGMWIDGSSAAAVPADLVMMHWPADAREAAMIRHPKAWFMPSMKDYNASELLVALVLLVSTGRSARPKSISARNLS